jgi:hypothetical protein
MARDLLCVTPGAIQCSGAGVPVTARPTPARQVEEVLPKLLERRQKLNTEAESRARRMVAWLQDRRAGHLRPDTPPRRAISP